MPVRQREKIQKMLRLRIVICVSEYDIIVHETEAGIYYRIKSKEKSVCPVCGGIELNIIGSRKRGAVDTEAKDICFLIRRLKCRGCSKIHHELPDLLVPYKRHLSETIESVIDGETNGVPCEDSTIRRIHRWFNLVVAYIAGCLEAQLFLKGITGSVPGLSALDRIKSIVGYEDSWLSRAVRIVVNTNNWIHTRSAFLSG